MAVAALMLVLAFHKGSLWQAMTSLGMWHFMAAGLLAGLRDRIVEPNSKIASVALLSAAATQLHYDPPPVHEGVERHVREQHAPLELKQR